MTGGSELGVPNKSLSKTLAFYSLTNLHMPNWNTNNVVIYAPIEEVKVYIVQTNNDSEEFMFNLHLLFPERYPASDPAWNESWNYDWAVANTGSKRFPELYIPHGDNKVTCLLYPTARTPNNGTLQRLHELTGWTIKNWYEEPGSALEGTFICNDDGCHNDERQ
jgi:hypothetical protein